MTAGFTLGASVGVCRALLVGDRSTDDLGVDFAEGISEAQKEALLEQALDERRYKDVEESVVIGTETGFAGGVYLAADHLLFEQSDDDGPDVSPT